MGRAIVAEIWECFDADFFFTDVVLQAVKLEQIPNSHWLASPQFNNPVNDKKDKQWEQHHIAQQLRLASSG